MISPIPIVYDADLLPSLWWNPCCQNQPPEILALSFPFICVRGPNSGERKWPIIWQWNRTANILNTHAHKEMHTFVFDGEYGNVLPLRWFLEVIISAFTHLLTNLTSMGQERRHFDRNCGPSRLLDRTCGSTRLLDSLELRVTSSAC